MAFFQQAPDFELEGRERRVRAQKPDHHGKAQVFAYLKPVGQQNQQKADQKRARDIDKKRRERKRLEKILQRRDVYQISRDRAACAARRDCQNSRQSFHKNKIYGKRRKREKVAETYQFRNLL